MLHILIGEDDYSLNQALGEIKRSLGDPANLATNTVTLGPDVTIDKLRGVCETMPFLAEKRLVIIEGLLQRFEPKKPGMKKPASVPKDDSGPLAEYFTHVPDFTVLVLVDGKIGAKNPLLAKLSRQAQVKVFPLLRDDRLRAWIKQRVVDAGGTISQGAVEQLARFVGSNLWGMAGEIEKLVLFTGGRRIEDNDVRAIVSSTDEANVFAMVDAILEFRADAAGQLLQKLLQSGAAPSYLLVMLSRQARLIVQAKDMASRKKPRAEIQDRLGLADFALRRTLEQANRYSLERLRELYHRLLEADLSIKTGKYDGELALNILVAELCSGRVAR
ncbi:MAG: DNA polymerase III subunit delta [Dehalococcoidales bacterium]|nr:DNA polymerase III subunit delta [Dehalococcoidales bacterium]